MTRCENCHGFSRRRPHCDRCARLALFGILVDQVESFHAANFGDQFGDHMTGLDAIADLLIDGAARREEHQRQLNEETRDGQREASAAFEDGRAREREEGAW